MPDHRPAGSPGEPPEGHEEHLDGVVLFDPTPRPPLQPPEPVEEPTRGARVIFVVALVAVAAAGGYELYRSRIAPPAAPEPPVALPEVPAADPTLTALGGDALAGRAGSDVAVQVRATGADGGPIADSLVQFQVLSGGGMLESNVAPTDESGIARALLHLPPLPGRIEVSATLVGSQLGTSLIVASQAGPPSRVVISDGNDQQAEVGELLPTRPEVAVTDGAGIPVPDAPVTFTVQSGGGMVAPSRARTDSLGLATALWRLGPAEGSQELSVQVPDLSTGVTFRANALRRPTIPGGRALPAEAAAVVVQPRTFAIGGSHVCTLTGSATDCRGSNDRGQRGLDAVSGLTAIVAGVSHTCGLRSSGEAVCWGANEGGQLGDGSRTDRPSPVPVRTQLRFSSLTAGASHTCGLAGGGVPVCWGQNLSGQLGDGSRNDARFPTAVGGGLNFTTLVAGWSHTCGLTSSGNAFCWGLNSDGQLGDGSRLDRLVPTLVTGAMESLAAGSAHTCGMSGARILCWGDNRFGQLGDGTTEGRDRPTAVTGLPTPATQVVAGAVHTCALVTDGTAYCWGQNLFGQIGDGSNESRSSATAVAGDLHFRSIYAGGAMTCGTSVDGVEYCWGLNQNGQLGDGTRQDRSVPTRVQ